jgi:hypothetical protein
MAKSKNDPTGAVAPLDRAGAARAAAVLRARDPATTPLQFGPYARDHAADGFMVFCKDGAVLQALKVLAEEGPALVDALARAEAARGDVAGG